MKKLNRNIACALVAGMGLMVGAMAHATDETGLVKVRPFATGSWAIEAAAVRFASPDPLKSGSLCTLGGDMVLSLAGEGGQAVYDAILAANINGKTVTITFDDDGSGNCTVLAAAL